MEERKFRAKITWFNFICCVLVIWNHSGNAELFFPGIAADDPLMHFEYRIVPEIIRVNIPCFIMLSGYLFYRDFSWDKLMGKWKRRVRSLLIPYLLWNTLYYAGYLLTSHVDGLQGIVNKPGLSLTFEGAFNAIVRFAFNPVFWFMYQLLILVALAPVLYFFLQRVWSGIIFLAVLLYALFMGVALPELNLDALIYYSAAAFIAVHLKESAEAPWSRRRVLFGIVLLAAGIFVGRRYYTEYFVPGIVLYQLAASISVWLMVNEERLGRIRPFMTCTFFIYAFHFIPVRFVNKAAAILFPGQKAVAVLLFFFMPVIAVSVCFQAARFLRRFLPKVCMVLNGGR